jgi:hypothetical protein
MACRCGPVEPIVPFLRLLVLTGLLLASASDDCSGWAVQAETWPTERVDSCCESHDVACDRSPRYAQMKQSGIVTLTSASSGPQYCDTADGTDEWNHEKSHWCCRKFHAGCSAVQESPYDCYSGHPSDWPSRKRDWCCLSEEQGCEDAVQARSTTRPTQAALDVASDAPDMFDCSDGLLHADRNWSPNKKAWCCKNMGVGPDCAGDPEGGKRFACDQGRSWSESKIVWCCMHEHKGCPVTSTVTTTTTFDASTTSITSATTTTTNTLDLLNYDCLNKLDMWRDEWSPLKKVWCCRHWELEMTWTIKKQEYCCLIHGTGCPVWLITTTITATDTTTTTTTILTDTTTTWTITGTTTTSTTTTGFRDSYNCSAGSESEWPAPKKEYCCLSKKQGFPRGVADTTTTWDPTLARPPLFDCEGGHDAERWARKKQAWCCEHRKLGCPITTSTTETSSTFTTTSLTTTTRTTTSVTVTYNCWVDVASWSAEQSSWCCAVYDKGCTTTTLTTTISSTTVTLESVEVIAQESKDYDCNAGVAYWNTWWAEDKRDFCCSRVVCPGYDTLSRKFEQLFVRQSGKRASGGGLLPLLAPGALMALAFALHRFAPARPWRDPASTLDIAPAAEDVLENLLAPE